MTEHIDTVLPEENHGFDYDLIVIGGGSGGLSASKAAAGYGKKVAVLDFVQPSPQGTTWGLGGTCVNVGCIPKKLMHQASLLGEAIEDSKSFGWELPEKINHQWTTLVDAVRNHIGSLNFGYRVDLRSKNVTYLNSYGVFTGPNTLQLTDKNGKKSTITSRRFVVATGGRPKYPDVPGAKEFGITSDDVFYLEKPPGKTLVVGASYVALECAGFLQGVGFDTTVMMRSIPLRGFDQQIAEMICEYMEQKGTKFIRNALPISITKGDNGKLNVTYNRKMGDYDLGNAVESYDTVLFAIGREAETKKIGLEKIGVNLSSQGKVVVNRYDQTSVPHVYAIGDIVQGGLELTPVAIRAGHLLAARLYGGETTPMDYVNVPTAVFTPIEYGCVGLSEEGATEKYGSDNIRVFHTYYTPLEWTIPHRPDNQCYMKLICKRDENEKVVGFHILGPNAGEITGPMGIAVRLGVTKSDIESTVGIHPTTGEEINTMKVDKSSGKDAKKTGC